MNRTVNCHRTMKNKLKLNIFFVTSFLKVTVFLCFEPKLLLVSEQAGQIYWTPGVSANIPIEPEARPRQKKIANSKTNLEMQLKPNFLFKTLDVC